MIEDKKFIETFDINDWEVFTDNGWEDVVKIHKTIPYQVWKITTKSFELECADKHLVFDENMFPTYVDELCIGKKIQTENGLEEIISIENYGYEENMYDLELNIDTNHRYYTNNILSHNTITTAIYLLWYAMAFDHKIILVTAQDLRAASENLGKIKGVYENCPDFLKKGLIEDNKSKMVFDNGSEIHVRPSTLKAPRGISPSIIYCDEFAFIGAQDSATKALEKQEEFYGALSPCLSTTHGQLFITSTPMSETDLFYRLWSGAIQKTDDSGLDIPKDYILKINGEKYRDFHLFHNYNDAEEFAQTLRNETTIVEVIEKEPCGNNGFQSQLVKWDSCPLRDKSWADAEIKKVGEEKFSREYNCISGDSIVNVMREDGRIMKISIEALYKYHIG